MLELRRSWLSAFIILPICNFVNAEVANFGYNPKGENPTLYDSASDPIIQLDEATFNDTVFCGGRNDCTAYLVEVSYQINVSKLSIKQYKKRRPGASIV